jgi:hypothetical protein
MTNKRLLELEFSETNTITKEVNFTKMNNRITSGIVIGITHDSKAFPTQKSQG